MLQLSVIVPVYSGADYLDALCAALSDFGAQLEADGAPLRLQEAIFVDDESRDDSARVLGELADRHDFVQVITLSRNFGQHGATIAGILHSSGDWVVSMDEDLQHPPELIPTLLAAAVGEQLDVVYGAPSGRAHSAFRDFASRTAKRLVAMVSGADQLNLASSFRAMRGPIARAAAATASHETYLDAALSWYTTRAHRIELDLVDERVQSGEASGYSLRRLVAHARRALTAGDMKFLRLIGGIGLLGVVAAAVLGVRLGLLWLTGNLDRSTAGWPSTFAALLFFGGVIAVQLVVLTEYAISSALHLRGKPAYFTVDRSTDAELADWYAQHPPAG